MESKPYVISEDLETAGPYVKQDQLDVFRDTLVADLEALGKTVDWVSFSEIQHGIRTLLKGTEIPVIALDNRYLDPDEVDASFGMSRAVSSDLVDVGYDSRVGFASEADQLQKIAQNLAGREVVLVDDVLFSGENISWTIDRLASVDVRVAAILGGVVIGEAAHLIADRGVDLEYVRTYEDVDDEVCERDFAFVYGSGRKVVGEETSALYFDPQFGKPAQWASIPQDGVQSFFLSNLERNLTLIDGSVRLGDIGNFLGYDGTLALEDNIRAAYTRGES